MEVVLGNDQRNSNTPARHQDVPRRSDHPIPMAFNNDIDNGNVHSSSSTDRESKKHSFREMTPANDRGYSNAPAHHRGFVERSEYMAGSPRNLRAEPCFGKRSYCSFGDDHHAHGSVDPASSAASYAMPTLRNDYLWRPQSHQPATGRSFQPDRPATTNRVHSFTGLASMGPRDTVRSKRAYSAEFL